MALRSTVTVVNPGRCWCGEQRRCRCRDGEASPRSGEVASADPAG